MSNVSFCVVSDSYATFAKGRIASRETLPSMYREYSQNQPSPTLQSLS